MLPTPENGQSRRLSMASNRHSLPRETIERIRGRNIRARFQSLAKWAGVIKFFFFSALIIGLSYLSIVQLRQLFFATSYFELKKIELDGLKTLNRDDVVKLAGVSPTMNVLNIDKEAIRSRLLLHPSIRSVRIDLEGLYTLRILVEERTPLMYVKAGPSFLEVADDGVVIAVSERPEKSFPIITGIEDSEKRVGESLLANDGFIEARIWVRNLDEKVLDGISEVNLANISNPYIYLISGVKIIPKDLSDFRERYVFLCALLDNLRKNRVEPEYLDLRAPSEIVVKPRKTKRTTEGGERSIAGG